MHQTIRPSVHWKCSNRCSERRGASGINSRYPFAKGDYVRMALLREPQQNHTGSLGAKGALRTQEPLYLQHSCSTAWSNLDSPPASISSHRTQFNMGDTFGHSLNAFDLRFLLPSYGECLEAAVPYNRRCLEYIRPHHGASAGGCTNNIKPCFVSGRRYQSAI